MVLCSQPIVGKNPPALGHPRCHVLCNITPPSPLHLHPVQSVTPKSDFVCFVDYIAMSAHSEFLYEINLETSRLDSAAKVHTPIQKLSLLVSCPPGIRIQLRGRLVVVPPQHLPFPSSRASIYTPLIRLLPQLPSTTPFHPPQTRKPTFVLGCNTAR